MYEYKLIKLNNSALPKLWKEWRELTSIYNEIMYFKKHIRATREVKIDKESKESKEWLEYITAYRKVNNNWSYDKRLIKKYHEVIEETPHKDIMENLKEYKLFLEVNKTRNPLQAWPYLNGRRYLDTWEIVKDQSRKFINDIFKELELTAEEIDNVKLEIKAYETKHNKEVTDWNVRSLIHYVRTWQPL